MVLFCFSGDLSVTLCFSREVRGKHNEKQEKKEIRKEEVEKVGVQLNSMKFMCNSKTSCAQIITKSKFEEL